LKSTHRRFDFKIIHLVVAVWSEHKFGHAVSNVTLNFVLHNHVLNFAHHKSFLGDEYLCNVMGCRDTKQTQTQFDKY
jgi:hypothetical protein